jgi:adenine-specific DNA-methyltransferase
MKARLEKAYDLLSDDGVIFISIDDNMQAYLKIICDEVFGKDAFVENLVWIKNPGGKSDSKWFAETHEYILCYAKNKDNLSIKDIEIADVDFLG